MALVDERAGELVDIFKSLHDVIIGKSFHIFFSDWLGVWADQVCDISSLDQLHDICQKFFIVIEFLKFILG